MAIQYTNNVAPCAQLQVTLEPTKESEPTHIDYAGVLAMALRGDVAANGKTRIAVLLTLLYIIAPSDWHIVNNPGGKINKSFWLSAQPALHGLILMIVKCCTSINRLVYQ